MADASVDITAGTGTAIDTRTESTNGNHRQVVVLGDPATNAGVAPVSATQGLGVNVASGGIASGAIASGAVASGAFASDSIAAGAIAAGATSIAENEDAASANGDRGIKVMFKRSDTPGNSSGTDLDYEQPQMSGGAVWVRPLSSFATVSLDITRPADTTAYAANDALSDSTSAPTSGGFTFSSVARASGGSGIITDLWVSSSNATGGMQGELWLFDSAVTNINDNSAFAISDAEIKTVVAKIAFTTVADTNNAGVHVQNLSIGYTTSGSANLRALVKVKAAYTPANAEVTTFRLKCLRLD